MGFITVQEAIKRTGKSERSLRRIIAKYKQTKHLKKSGRKWLISEAILNLTPTANNGTLTATEKALQDHIQSLKNEVAYLRAKLDDKERLLEQIDAKLIALFEGKPTTAAVMRIMTTDIDEEKPSVSPPDEHIRKPFTQWL